MHRMTPPRFASWFVPFLLVVALERPAAAQSERVQRVFTSAVANLGEPSLVADSLRRLENLGAAAVPLLRAELAWPGRRKLPTATVCNLLHVLGRLGRAGLPAVDDLRAVLRNDEAETALQAAWALGELSPFLTPERAATIEGDLGATMHEVRDSTMAGMLRLQLAITRNPSTAMLLQLLGNRGELERMAACRWLVASSGTERADRQDLLRVVDEQLAMVTRRPLVSWFGPGPGSYTLAEMTEAWLALSHQALDARCARGLLANWDKDQRQRGILWLQENGNTLPPRERIDLVARLWDSDAEVVRATTKALAAWGVAGLVALVPLRSMEQGHADATIARHAGDAADAIVAAGAALPETDRAWLQAADDTLRGKPMTEPARPLSAEGSQRVCEMLFAAQWSDPGKLDQLLSLLERAGPCPTDAVMAVYGWLQHGDAEVVGVACAWLARRGTAVRAAVEAAAEFEQQARPGGWPNDGFDLAIRRLARFQVTKLAIPVATELAAHVLVAAATAGDRAALLEDPNLRFVARAIADGLLLPGHRLQGTANRLRVIVDTPIYPGVLVVCPPWDSGITLPADLGGPVRTLAALALADLGAPLGAAPDLDGILVEQIGVHLADLPAHVKSLHETNALDELVTRLEDRCRERLGVRADLRWLPPAAR